MEGTGSTGGRATSHPPQGLNNHRKLVARIFQPSETVGDDRDEMFHCAASQGMLSTVLALLANEQFSYDLADRFGRTPLHWAAEQGCRNVALALLRAGACVDPRSQRKATPIMLAASRGHLEVVNVLLHYRAGESDCGPLNRHRRDMGYSGTTALHCAAAGGHVRVVRRLLDIGFNRGQHDEAGLTPAEVSARQSHSTSSAITRLLLSSEMGGKLVHDYANKVIEDVATVSGLVEGGAFLDWQDGTGDTPLHRAVNFHHDTISRVLLKAGADPNLSDRLGVSPLHTAAFHGRGDVVADLIEAGADLEPLSVSGHCPLHEAVVNNRANVVSVLLKAGASTEHRDTIHGQTPLSWACRGCLAPIVRVLVETGANLESRSSAGLTPLHWACRFNDAESVEALLKAGANPGAVDQAAATYAVEMSLSRSGMSVLMPVAIDVIDLGYPLDYMENSSRRLTDDSEASAARRLDLVSVRRIESALHDAQQNYYWRRRGWLVILAHTYVAMNLSVVRDKRWVECRVGSRPLLPDGVSPITNNDTSDSRHVQKILADTQNHVSKSLRNVDKAMGIAKATLRQQGHMRGEIRDQENTREVFVPRLVGALLELAAVEVGVFRKVVMFI